MPSRNESYLMSRIREGLFDAYGILVNAIEVCLEEVKYRSGQTAGLI